MSTYVSIALRPGSESLWGPVQGHEEIGFGLIYYSCERHGGAILTAKQNRSVPKELRLHGGAYEEDVAILRLYEAFSLWRDLEHRDRVRQSLRRYLPGPMKVWEQMRDEVEQFLEDCCQSIPDLHARLYSHEGIMSSVCASARRVAGLIRNRQTYGDVFTSKGELREIALTQMEATTMVCAWLRNRALKDGDPYPVFLDTKPPLKEEYAVFVAGETVF